MRNLCVVHVGMHKTGSSSIQNALSKSVAPDRFHYANLPDANQSMAMYSLFARSPEDYHGHKVRGWDKHHVDRWNLRNRASLVEGFASVDYNVPEIISGEDIGYLDVVELIRMKEFLLNYFERILILAYVRPLVPYVQSAFQELVKHGLSRLDFTYCDPNYIRFKAMVDVFGKECVILRKFDESSLLEGSAVVDFYQVLRLGPPPESALVRKNESISLEAVQLLYIYQKYYSIPLGQNYLTERHNLVSALSRIGTSKLRFSKTLIEPVVEKNRAGMEFVSDQFGIRLDDHNEFDLEGISSEEDLLAVSDETLRELSGVLRREIACAPTHLRTFEIASAIDSLRHA